MIPIFVVKTIYPNCLEGNKLDTAFSYPSTPISNLGEITPHLFILPNNSMTTLPPLLSSTTSKSPM